jgi:hypothetical protein
MKPLSLGIDAVGVPETGVAALAASFRYVHEDC